MRVIAFLLIFTLAPTAKSSDIRHQGTNLRAQIDPRRKALSSYWRVITSERCHAKGEASSIGVSSQCGYLDGYYEYGYQPVGETLKRKVVTPFALHQNGAQSYVLLVEAPFEVYAPEDRKN